MSEFDFSGGVSAFLPKALGAAKAARLGAAVAASMGAAALALPSEASARDFRGDGPAIHYVGGHYRDAAQGGIAACHPGYARVNCVGQAQDGSLVRFDGRGRVAEVRHPNGVHVHVDPHSGARTVIVPQPQQRVAPQAMDRAYHEGLQRGRQQGYSQGYQDGQGSPPPGYYGQRQQGFSLGSIFGQSWNGTRPIDGYLGGPQQYGNPEPLVGNRMGPVTFR